MEVNLEDNRVDMLFFGGLVDNMPDYNNQDLHIRLDLYNNPMEDNILPLVGLKLDKEPEISRTIQENCSKSGSNLDTYLRNTGIFNNFSRRVTK